MLYKLNIIIQPNTGVQNIENEWKYLMQNLVCQNFLLKDEVSRMDDMFDIFDTLMTKGVIDFGKYDNVKRLMSYSTGLLKHCFDTIDEFEQKMNSNTSHGFSGKYGS